MDEEEHILEYTGERQEQLQQQNRLLYDYTEPVDSSNEDSTDDDEMVKKKDYTGVKDHLDETQMKPISVPTSVDVYEFKKTLANALAEVVSIKYIQGSGYAFLLESEGQYKARDASAQYPTAPTEPRELDCCDRAHLRHALLITDKKFPTMLDDLKDPGSETFPRGTTVLAAFQTMEADLCTTDAQHRLTRELSKKMNNLSYTPSPIGPKEYFRQLTKYQWQINLLPETAEVSSAQMMDYARDAFMRSKHDPITLHRVNEDWKQHRTTIAKGDEFIHYKTFWGQRLKELYSAYHNKTASANMVDIHNDRRFTDLETQQLELANVCQEIYLRVSETTASTATAASTMTMSHQWETAMASLQADVNRLKATDAGRPRQAASGCPLAHEWKQYKYYCHSCGVNLSHTGRECFHRRNKAAHQEGASYDNQMGGSTRNNDRWMITTGKSCC
eukprot:jgi/Psemu1/52785/gm1.52785_g